MSGLHLSAFSHALFEIIKADSVHLGRFEVDADR
jgi:hypothetical protein